jgi:ribosomal protein L11 methyltransferase
MRVLAIDTDPVAVGVAAKNAGENGVADVFRAETTPLSAIPDAFDLVLGNLIAEILIDMAPELLRRTIPGGHLILSGILAEKSAWVAEEFAKNGASLRAESADGQWTALLFRRGA